MDNNLRDQLLVKNGNSYVFTYQHSVNQLPGGVYLPAKSNDGHFILVNAERVKHADPETVRDLLDGMLIDRSTSTMKGGQDPLAALPKFSSDANVNVNGWSDPAYFPMYNYHPGLRKVKHTLDHFLSHKAFYAKNRLDYKRSFMLFGDPGTGKSRFVDETTRSLVETHNAVVIRVESDSQLAILADVGVPELHSFLPGRMKIFVLEELAELLERSRNEARLLNFLDSTFFRHDVLYFITTNYPEKIPQNIVDRPSRVDDLIAINSTDFEAGFIPAWYEHLLGRSFPKSEIKSAWLKETCGRISPAYLKELFLYAELHQCSLDYSWKQIKDRRRMIDNNFCPTRERKMGFHLEPDLPKHHSRADVTEGIIEEEDDFLEELRKMLDSED